jgi:peptidoglycan lytic transglycosylase G
LSERLAVVLRLVRMGLLVLALVLSLRLYWVVETQTPVRAADAAPQPLVVAPGSSAEAIGRQLAEMGLVRHPLVFRLLVLVRGVGGSLKAGEYSLEGPMSLEQIVDVLARGEVVRNEVTFPEGLNAVEASEIVGARGLSADAFLQATKNSSLVADLDADASDLEGYLFPDTYDIPRTGDPEGVLVARMIQRFRDVMAPELPRIAEKKLTVRQVVTLASLVERETARPEERPRIAAVFLNRLRKGMLLQTDPTVIYALRLAGRWDGNIRRADLQIDSPYNTYRYPGIPPGPIANPGRGALLGVIDPMDVKDLYFVSRNDGTHQFSETLAQHNRAVDRYQRRRPARAAGS